MGVDCVDQTEWALIPQTSVPHQPVCTRREFIRQLVGAAIGRSQWEWLTRFTAFHLTLYLYMYIISIWHSIDFLFLFRLNVSNKRFSVQKVKHYKFLDSNWGRSFVLKTKKSFIPWMDILLLNEHMIFWHLKKHGSN